MRIFTEIYGCYYNIIYRLLSDYEKVTDKEMADIIREKGYGESMLFLLPKLKEDVWELFGEARPDPVIPMSRYQKSWLKQVLMDKRIGLFLKQEEIQGLLKQLTDVEPLFRQEDICATDIFLDGDDYSDEKYQENFRVVVDAIRNNEVLDMEYNPTPGKRVRHYFIPCRVEYSIKNDCIRVFGVEEKSRRRLYQINLGKVVMVNPTGRYISKDNLPDVDRLMEKEYLEEPVTLLIKTERNALERAMLQFANYRKNTSLYVEKRDDDFDGTKNEIYKCEIYYGQGNETELLINILSFGPMVKVIGSKRFLRLVKERLNKQRMNTGNLVDSSR